MLPKTVRPAGRSKFAKLEPAADRGRRWGESRGIGTFGQRTLAEQVLKYDDEARLETFAATDRFIARDDNGRHVDADERRNGAAGHWLEWLPGELAKRESSAASRLLVLWDVLEEWFGSEDFQVRVADGLIGGVELPGPGHPEHDAVVANRHSLRRLLEDLAKEVGAPDPGELASQLQMLFEGAVIGALIDGQPQVARIARHLAVVALAASAGARPGGPASSRPD
jgi:hypothetical protein